MIKLNQIQLKKIKIAKNILGIIKNNNPRIGGSCALFLQGKRKDFRDVDIIVDNIDNISLPYMRMPLLHKKRLNRTIKYNIDGIEIDIIECFDKNEETIKVNNLNVSTFKNVIKYKTKVMDFLKKEYNE